MSYADAHRLSKEDIEDVGTDLSPDVDLADWISAEMPSDTNHIFGSGENGYGPYKANPNHPGCVRAAGLVRVNNNRPYLR